MKGSRTLALQFSRHLHVLRLVTLVHVCVVGETSLSLWGSTKVGDHGPDTCRAEIEGGLNMSVSVCFEGDLGYWRSW